MTDEERAQLDEAQRKLEAKRNAMATRTAPIEDAQNPQERREAPRRLSVSRNLDPESWPLATCPTCDCPPRKVPPAYARQCGWDPLSGAPVVPCDDCRMEAQEEQRRRAEEFERRREAEEMAAQRARLPQLLKVAGVPWRYQRLSRASWEAKYRPWAGGPYAKLIGWPSSARLERDQFAVAYGLYGVRKTGLLVAVLGEAILAGHRCRFEDTGRWLREMKANGFAHAEAVFRRAADADVLMLDDFMQSGGSRAVERDEWDLTMMAEILRHCHMEGKPTLISLNGEFKDFEAVNSCLPSRLDTDLKFHMKGRDRRIEP